MHERIKSSSSAFSKETQRVSHTVHRNTVYKPNYHYHIQTRQYTEEQLIQIKLNILVCYCIVIKTQDKLII
jgi:hypothetical protein